MIDPRFLVENPDLVKADLTKRHATDLLQVVDRVMGLQVQRAALIAERDGLRNNRNTLSKQIGQLYKAGKRDEAESAKQEVATAAERIKVVESELETIEGERDELMMTLPNRLAEDVPEGEAEEDNPVLRTWGERPELDFTPQSHVEVGSALGILDLDRSTKLAGARFAILKGAGARLERALINFFLDLHTDQHGYTEVMVPYMVHRHALEGTGQLPKFEQDLFRLQGQLNGSDTFLIPTAEVPVTNIHREEILDESELPKRFACFTPCFRSEAGSAGRDVRGIIRQHQFHKVELVWLTTPDQARENHDVLVAHAEKVLQLLGLHYRAVLHCGGEVSFSATRCIDLEVWLPSLQMYREISSVSWFGDFQARRMQLRYRPTSEGGKKAKPRLAHTLNGSGLAVGRTMVAILDNFQQEDGSVIIPEVLRPYMGGIERLSPPSTESA